MSFDLFSVVFRSGVSATGDAAAARSVLERYRFDRDPDFNHYEIYFDDGSHLGLNASGLDGRGEFGSAMFILRSLTEPIGTFIFELSRASGSVVFPAMEPPCVLIPREDLTVHLPADLPPDYARVPVSSGTEVLAVLSGGFKSWQAYRDHVMRTSGGSAAGM